MFNINRSSKSFLIFRCINNKCRTSLNYIENSSTGVLCPICNTVTPIVTVDYINCGKCFTNLMFASGI